jgi:hypothetical protein
MMLMMIRLLILEKAMITLPAFIRKAFTFAISISAALEKRETVCFACLS